MQKDNCDIQVRKI